ICETSWSISIRKSDEFDQFFQRHNIIITRTGICIPRRNWCTVSCHWVSDCYSWFRTAFEGYPNVELVFENVIWYMRVRIKKIMLDLMSYAVKKVFVRLAACKTFGKYQDISPIIIVTRTVYTF